jgi:hypothetical protein
MIEDLAVHPGGVILHLIGCTSSEPVEQTDLRYLVHGSEHAFDTLTLVHRSMLSGWQIVALAQCIIQISCRRQIWSWLLSRSVLCNSWCLLCCSGVTCAATTSALKVVAAGV